jgi:hypothetical protein
LVPLFIFPDIDPDEPDIPLAIGVGCAAPAPAVAANMAAARAGVINCLSKMSVSLIARVVSINGPAAFLDVIRRNR